MSKVVYSTKKSKKYEQLEILIDPDPGVYVGNRICCCKNSPNSGTRTTPVKFPNFDKDGERPFTSPALW